MRAPARGQQVGECGRECKTVAKAAEQILGEHDTDLAERLLKGGTSRAALTEWLCSELSTACSNPTPPLPADRPKGPPFTPLPEDEVSVVNMMGEMRAKGMRGKLVRPEDMLDAQGRMGAWECVARHASSCFHTGDEEEDDDMFGMMGGGLGAFGDSVLGHDEL